MKDKDNPSYKIQVKQLQLGARLTIAGFVGMLFLIWLLFTDCAAWTNSCIESHGYNFDIWLTYILGIVGIFLLVFGIIKLFKYK